MAILFTSLLLYLSSLTSINMTLSLLPFSFHNYYYNCCVLVPSTLSALPHPQPTRPLFSFVFSSTTLTNSTFLSSPPQPPSPPPLFLSWSPPCLPGEHFNSKLRTSSPAGRERQQWRNYIRGDGKVEGRKRCKSVRK